MPLTAEVLLVSGLILLAIFFVMGLLIGGFAGATVVLWRLGKLTARDCPQVPVNYLRPWEHIVNRGGKNATYN